MKPRSAANLTQILAREPGDDEFRCLWECFDRTDVRIHRNAKSLRQDGTSSRIGFTQANRVVACRAETTFQPSDAGKKSYDS